MYLFSSSGYILLLSVVQYSISRHYIRLKRLFYMVGCNCLFLYLNSLPHLVFMHVRLRKHGYLRMWDIHNAGKTLYRDRSRIVEFSLHLENKLQPCQIMWRLNTSICIHNIKVFCVI